MGSAYMNELSVMIHVIDRFTPFIVYFFRFSYKTPVPMLGDINTTKAEVEAFYDFW